MIISDEQARLAAEYLRTGHGSDARSASSRTVSGDLLARVRESVDELPDVRADRVAQAKAALADQPSPEEVAGKLIGRVVSDSLR
ncbi:MAG: flagellar biosynthesis anti-sigma factor FlgM [Actinobacteria bacterium]|nr:MAG: flagellar biosynthesis anti-sigma factor FlgM [Actinomycetota bacterium]